MTHDNVTDIVEQAQKHWDDIVIDFGDYKTSDCERLANWAIKHGSQLLSENATIRKQLENARSEALEEAAGVVEAAKVQDHVATLAPEMAKIINNGFDEIAQLIRALKGQP